MHEPEAGTTLPTDRLADLCPSHDGSHGNAGQLRRPRTLVPVQEPDVPSWSRSPRSGQGPPGAAPRLRPGHLPATSPHAVPRAGSGQASDEVAIISPVSPYPTDAGKKVMLAGLVE